MKNDSFIEEWLVLGPFIMETGGAFEKEYLYEREKILNVDYLEDIGGEAVVRPYEGVQCPNRFFGPDTLTWEKAQTLQNRLSFVDKTGEALYHTIQRNAVWYAAFYLECEKDTEAFLRFEHSGVRIFVNGEIIFDQPYGRTKGLSIGESCVLVNLKKGLNLIMAKVRPGFIADGIDFEISNFRITPVALNIKGMSVSIPEKSGLFFGPVSSPRQVFTVLVGSLEGKKTSCFIGLREPDTNYDQSIEVKDLRPGDVCVIRLGLPATDTRRNALAKLYVKDYMEEISTEFELEVDAFTGDQGQEFVFSEFHFDTTYHEEQRVYAFGAFDICRNYMQQFRKDPNFKGILSEIDYLHPYYSIFVEDRKLLREVFMEGRAEPDSFYNQPNEMSVFEEGLVRNLVYGQLYHGNVLGRRCIVYSPGDVFGHPAQLSQLAAKGGCIGLAWDKYILGLPPLFRHVSPDGSALVHRRGRVTRYEARMMGFSSSIGVADKGAPSDWLNHLVPVKKLAVPSEFHDAIIGEEKAIIASKKGKKPIPLTSRDISLYHAGTALSRIDLKIADRLGESLLISAEKFATIASLLGANYPERALDKAWRQLLCGQHHDSITGTHNEISYVDLMIAYRESVEIASEVLNRSLSFLSEAIEVKCNKDEIPIHVYNPHSWRRKDVCFVNLNLSKKLSEYELRDIKGQKCEMQLVSEDVKGDSYHYCVAFLAEVPPLGYTTYYLTPSMNTIKKALRLEDEYTIENEYYRIQVDPEQGGGIVSIYDKEEGREILDTSKDGPGNRICVLKEYPDRNEAQHEFYTTGLKAFSSEYKAKVSVEKGPVMEKIIVEGHIGTICETRQEITLFKGVKRIDFKTFIIDYEDEDDLFVVTFPFNLKGVVPTFDERYAAVVKTKSKGKLDFRTHQMFMFSGCAVYSANRWIDYGPSVKFVIQDGGQTISEHSIGMVALIRPEEPEMVEAADKFLIALTKKGLHVTQWPDGEQEQIGSLIKHFNEDLLNTDTRIVLTTTRLENKYAAELIGRLSEREREQFFTAVEEKGSSTLFMVDRDNLWGKPIDVVIIAGASIDHLQKRLNRMEVELANNETIILDDCIFKAEKGIVDNYGISLINTGNIACSVEQGGILTLMLFHTAKWYGGTGNITEEYFVPERKTHVFRYSLYPHAGTWRDAKTY